MAPKPQPDEPDASDKPDHLGHRERLRERFLAGGADALPDYEMLELLLFGALARADTKPLAKRLLDRFGSFANVISAAPADLKSVNGVGDSVVATLKIVRDAAACVARPVYLSERRKRKLEKTGKDYPKNSGTSASTKNRRQIESTN